MVKYVFFDYFCSLKSIGFQNDETIFLFDHHSGTVTFPAGESPAGR
jgi:hypothetical protein